MEPLLRWWQDSGGFNRPYPWRRSSDPYVVLISEILLQRTRRDKVTEVFGEFISRFPTPEDLASAPLDEIRKVIAPLGLIKRAAYLKKLGSYITEHPDVLEKHDFERLPGVGKYVSSAARVILGVETELKADSSIARVLSRYFRLPLDRRPGDTDWVNRCLNECAPAEPREKRKYFLSLVDLAWEICKARKPLCHSCPLSRSCRYLKKCKTLSSL